ncbi:putative nicotinate-nucleotide adenylyltransferase [Metarhizium album ARSEF 1941]|uniref:Nicotinamide-nucleotide adenylyltransferase n=1 Tax=Metarhizium album (strain ARSEF 1941) TaxID=1081103 RepID=A0A0B2X910_METAS|nr:putative nicotinate-nucleotide adenylyltransferase [Metarhizium album ARSEF 1941]KHO02060.1 putative nicotinate-nucleotide adenylyltransferase [Metarhizium album ARSEF 1941]
MAVATDGSDFDFVRRMTPEGYVFPTHRLKQTCAPGKVPLIIVACGSFSPVTLLHLRMFPMALDHAKNIGFDVVGGYLSPVGDAYKKNGLVRAHHRVNMCRLAAENTSKWLMVDTWEAENHLYMPTARVLDHFDWEINHVRGGVETTEGTRVPAKIMLLAGADLIQTISTPEVWDVGDVDHILGNFGVFVLERTGTDLETALGQLRRWEKNIHVIRQIVTNNISSTTVRLLLKRDMSIDYLIPQEAVEYIMANNLYRDMDLQPTEESKGKGKGRAVQPSGS